MSLDDGRTAEAAPESCIVCGREQSQIRYELTGEGPAVHYCADCFDLLHTPAPEMFERAR